MVLTLIFKKEGVGLGLKIVFFAQIKTIIFRAVSLLGKVIFPGLIYA